MDENQGLDVVVDFDTAVEKPKMISLKEQRTRNRNRSIAKRVKRRIKNPPQVQAMAKPLGNKDFGIPFRGKDKFAGTLSANAGFVTDETRINEDTGRKEQFKRYTFFDRNKYNGNGTLKED